MPEKEDVPMVVAKKRKFNDGEDFSVGLVSNPITETGTPRCNKCRNPVEKDKYRVTGKHKSVYTCNTCNTRSAQLSTAYGSWPPERFKVKSADEIAKSYDDIKNIRNAKDFKLFTDDVLDIS